MFKYFPHTNDDLEAMKASLGINSLDELFVDLPQEIILHREYDVPPAMSEVELRRHFRKLASANQDLTCFVGLGIYDHYAPSVIKTLVSRQEFLTSYTPYQAEVAQGTLQYIFEYQSMIQMLTGMDVSNASMYDGATATAEAVFMAEAITRRKRILLSSALHPNTIAVVKTYAHYKGLQVELLELADGATCLESLKKALAGEPVAAVVVQKPNFFGIIEDIKPVAAAAHEAGALLIENADPSALGVLQPPRDDGADIVVGDCQSLGMPMAFGGPTLGYMATLKKHVRKMPGRICGASLDVDGQRAFVLTLQAREQHIRRDKANSNICSNQSLMALYATIYLSVMGPAGLRRVNELSYQQAHKLHDRLLETGKFKQVFKRPFLKEFVLESLIPVEKLQAALLSKGIFAAAPLCSFDPAYAGKVAFAATEKRSDCEIDALISIMEDL